MAGRASVGPGNPRVLVEETRRVLDAQQQLVHRQRTRATSVIRIALTACGLALTLVSLGLTTNLEVGKSPGLQSIGIHSGGLGRLFVLALLATLSVLVCRMLCAALVVLEPSTAAHPIAELLTAPVFSDERPTPDHAALPKNRYPTLRAGLDATAATELSETAEPHREILAYNAGCVAGNAVLVRHNRWYLTRVYRSATAGVGIVTIGVLVALAVHAGLH